MIHSKKPITKKKFEVSNLEEGRCFQDLQDDDFDDDLTLRDLNAVGGEDIEDQANRRYAMINLVFLE